MPHNPAPPTPPGAETSDDRRAAADEAAVATLEALALVLKLLLAQADCAPRVGAPHPHQPRQ